MPHANSLPRPVTDKHIALTCRRRRSNRSLSSLLLFQLLLPLNLGDLLLLLRPPPVHVHFSRQHFDRSLQVPALRLQPRPGLGLVGSGDVSGLHDKVLPPQGLRLIAPALEIRLLLRRTLLRGAPLPLEPLLLLRGGGLLLREPRLLVRCRRTCDHPLGQLPLRLVRFHMPIIMSMVVLAPHGLPAERRAGRWRLLRRRRRSLRVRSLGRRLCLAARHGFRRRRRGCGRRHCR
mmetsp:Transcript_115957/g.368800  ORF Transcript_115957/g.368800 Transcript_115957/m.368800 type:complete len:233 (+) Transcript_115957:516-1214(+)